MREKSQVLWYTARGEMPPFSQYPDDNAEADDQAKVKRCGATGGMFLGADAEWTIQIPETDLPGKAGGTLRDEVGVSAGVTLSGDVSQNLMRRRWAFAGCW